MKFALRALAAISATIMLVTLSTATTAGGATPIEIRYNSEPALAKLLGKATGSEFLVAGGRQRNYQWGSLYFSGQTGVSEVHGAIWHRYQSLGGPAGKLGFPVNDEQSIPYMYDAILGKQSHFQRGWITYEDGSNITHWISTAIADRWHLAGGKYMGMPLTDEYVVRGGYEVRFDSGEIYRSNSGVVGMQDIHIGSQARAKYLAMGGANSLLGLPIGDFDDWAHRQAFQFGAIYEGPAGAKEVHGSILWTYEHTGGPTKYGLPIADEQAAPGGRLSRFEQASIFWDAKTGKTSIRP